MISSSEKEIAFWEDFRKVRDKLQQRDITIEFYSHILAAKTERKLFLFFNGSVRIHGQHWKILWQGTGDDAAKMAKLNLFIVEGENFSDMIGNILELTEKHKDFLKNKG